MSPCPLSTPALPDLRNNTSSSAASLSLLDTKGRKYWSPTTVTTEKPLCPGSAGASPCQVARPADCTRSGDEIALSCHTSLSGLFR
jgi:hypothetical protein